MKKKIRKKDGSRKKSSGANVITVDKKWMVVIKFG